MSAVYHGNRCYHYYCHTVWDTALGKTQGVLCRIPYGIRQERVKTLKQLNSSLHLLVVLTHNFSKFLYFMKLAATFVFTSFWDTQKTQKYLGGCGDSTFEISALDTFVDNWKPFWIILRGNYPQSRHWKIYRQERVSHSTKLTSDCL